MSTNTDPTPPAAALRYSPLGQLILARLREFYREPEAVFWVYGFPILMAALLGIAFRNKPIERSVVDVVQSEKASEVVESLSKTSRFVTTVGDESTCRRRLRTAKTDVVVLILPLPFGAGRGEGQHNGNLPTAPGYEYLYDNNRPESVLARNAVDDALQRAAGRTDAVAVTDRQFDEPGGRYIDFLIPGLLGMSLMGGGLWGVGFVIVDMRLRKLLKRFLATPMKKTDFLLAIMCSRLLFLIPEVLVLLAFSRVAFGVRIHGNPLTMVLLIVIGAAAFAGIGLLVASRAKTIEAVSGLMNLIMLPMWMLSGIFFSSERFPETVQPFVKILPLTMLNDALRAVMLDGLSLNSQWVPIAGLSAWGLASFALALRWFRWN